MKKSLKTFKLVLIAVMLMLSTGCVKYNMTMDIKKDKSMDFSMIVAVDESMATGEDFDVSSAKDEIQNKNCSVSDYSQSNMKGISILCKFPNIDELSSEEEIGESDIENVISDENTKLFKIKKGFLKNTYVIKMDSSSSNDIMSREEDDYSYDDDDDYYYDDDYDYDYYDDDDSDDLFDSSDIDYATAMKSMDLKFEVKLPYKAISSNATSKDDDGKHLTWNLMEMSQSDNSVIELEFPVYNISNIAILVVIIIVIIGGLIFFMKKRKKPMTGVTNVNTNNGTANQNTGVQDMFGNNFPVNNTGVAVMPTSNTSAINTNNGPQDMFENSVSANSTTMPTNVNTGNVESSEPVNTSVNNNQVSLSNIPAPVNDVPKSDDLI